MSKMTENDLLEEIGRWHKFIKKWYPGAEAKKAAQVYKRIVELIKIFFAKEISSGPIKEDISRPVLIAWLEGINQAATAVNDDYVMKATTQLIEIVQEPTGVDDDWLPTAENINALPMPVRNYIAALETNADPPSMVQENILLKDTCRTLEKMLEERPAVDEGFVNIWAKEFINADNTPSTPVTIIKRMLNEAGVEVIKT